jgi:hypothetical protein
MCCAKVAATLEERLNQKGLSGRKAKKISPDRRIVSLG